MWVKFRHKIVFAILRPIFTVYLKLKYGYTAKKFKTGKGPYLILFNHPTNLDPFMVALSIKSPIYYIANEDLFNIPYLSKIIRYLVNPIPKLKSIKDMSAVKTAIKVVREGGNVGVSPEGNRTYSGKLNHIDIAIVKLIRLLKVPVILYTIKGGYGVNPRFSRKLRKGKMFGEVARLLEVDEVKNLTDEEVLKIIRETLEVDDPSLGLEYKGKNLAEHLESVFYKCPVCASLNTMYSSKNILKCNHCNLSVEYTPKLTFKTENPKFIFTKVSEYYYYQEGFIRSIDVDNFSFSDSNITIRKVVHRKKKQNILLGNLHLDKNGLIIQNENNKIQFSIDEIISIAILYHNTVIINVVDNVYHLVGDERFNGLKYMHLFYVMRHKKQGVTDGFLGI